MLIPLDDVIDDLKAALSEGRLDDIAAIATRFPGSNFASYLLYLLADAGERTDDLMSVLTSIPGVVTRESATSGLIQACVVHNVPAVLALTPHSEAMDWTPEVIAQFPPDAARAVQSVIAKARLSVSLPMACNGLRAGRL